MQDLRLASQRLSFANTEPRMMLGNHRISKDDWTVRLLVTAAIEGNIPAVRKLARNLQRSGKSVGEAVAAVKDRQYSGRGPHSVAALAGRREMCKFLIKDLRLNVNAPDDDGLTPLSYAIVGCGSTSVIRFLLDHGANPNKADTKGFTALHYATITVKCAELLIKAGADVNAGRPATPLVIAASQGFTDCIKCLLEAGADANIPGKCGRTPVEIAVARGWMDCAEILSPLTFPAGIDDPAFGENDGWSLKEQGGAALEGNNGVSLKTREDGAFEPMVLKMQGDAAFEENGYAYALALYTKAMESDPDDSSLYAKRSLCWLRLSEEDNALDDANTYKTMEMDLTKSCYEQAVALILTQEYAQACQALMSGLKLDLRSDDLD